MGTALQIESSAKEQVYHPDHYQGDGLEVMDVLESFMTEEQLDGFCRGNVIKYMLRSKNPILDKEKARAYLNYMIDKEF